MFLTEGIPVSMSDSYTVISYLCSDPKASLCILSVFIMLHKYSCLKLWVYQYIIWNVLESY